MSTRRKFEQWLQDLSDSLDHRVTIELGSADEAQQLEAAHKVLGRRKRDVHHPKPDAMRPVGEGLD